VFYWLMKYVVIGPLSKAIFRPWIVGRRNIPAEGGAILASNHLSFIDSVFLPLMIDRRVSFLAKSDYFTGKGLKGWATRFFLTASGQLPIDRSGGKASEASLNTGLQVLGRGDLLGIYPEGTRSPDGRLYRGRTGIARMALEAHVPVVPVVMVDTDTMMPIGTRIPRVVRIGIVVGEPLDFSRFAGMEGDRYILRSVTDEIMVALQRLGEQQYDDVYASTVKDRMPSRGGSTPRSIAAATPAAAAAE
jgi:1-acyl-sn-glycerol-3-phosphate acyltransferase